jgi:hypothetical protein
MATLTTNILATSAHNVGKELQETITSKVTEENTQSFPN